MSFPHFIPLLPNVFGKDVGHHLLAQDPPLTFHLLQASLHSKFVNNSFSCVIIYPQSLRHQLHVDHLHLQEEVQHPPEETGVGDRRVGGHLNKLDVGAGDPMLGDATHSAVETEDGAWLGWRTAGDFKAGTMGVTSVA